MNLTACNIAQHNAGSDTAYGSLTDSQTNTTDGTSVSASGSSADSNLSGSVSGSSADSNLSGSSTDSNLSGSNVSGSAYGHSSGNAVIPTHSSSGTASLVPSGHMELAYAEQFSVDYYEGGFSMVTIGDDSFLLVPEGQEAPAGLEMPCIMQPLSSIYIASSSAMDLFLHCGALDKAAMTSTAASDWSIPDIRNAISDGSITYVGKYHSPDYETILNKDCGLALENTMIYHSPETKEMLESLGIPVIVEWSSYEPHPLGRVEWIKLYGLLTGHEDEAEAFFNESLKTLETVIANSGNTSNHINTAGSAYTSNYINTPDSDDTCNPIDAQDQTAASNSGAVRKTVSFFYITSTGYANIRRPGDYVSKMIELAGGDYFFPESRSDKENSLTTLNMDLETFYTTSKDADILIYNSTVEADLTSIADLITKSPLLADFKAVKTGDVWCTNKNMFQQISGTADMISEMYSVIHGDNERELNYLHKLRKR